jgi:fatty-acyl-CoA synthase
LSVSIIPARTCLEAWIRALDASAKLTTTPTMALPLLIDELAETYGERPALISDTESLTYRSLADLSHRYARWALANGIKPGDVVALLMPNRAEYVAVWLGITRVCGVVALLNTSLVGAPLLHSIGTVAPKHLIVDATLGNQANAILRQLPVGLRCWSHGDGGLPGAARIDLAIRDYSGAELDDADCPRPCIADRALHIYTSGTTGLPKAANITHMRVLEWSRWFAAMMETSPADRMYNCLPMYHSTGGIVAIGALLVSGGSVVLRPRFSASRFWQDITSHGCTIFQYIGDLCRYLVTAPPQPAEDEHNLRLCCGNGLQPAVWETFQERFRIPRILEFYASTEGNVSLYNCEGKPGAIGRVPSFLAHRFPVALIRSDEAGNPIRDAEGHCLRCAAGEAGEAIGRILAASDSAITQFDGYTDTAASDGKVLRDVFTAGDRWFRTGDLMRKDAAGYYYFVDRIGDTFRWKGENVSTAEVSDVLCRARGVHQAVVYGVAVAGTEGRAGMAALTVGPDFELEALRRHMDENLPDYACPLFLRLCTALEVTGTFKPTKQHLASQGFAPGSIQDPLYFNDRAAKAYIELDTPLHAAILSGEVRL